jgi:hypothetical protein
MNRRYRDRARWVSPGGFGVGATAAVVALSLLLSACSGSSYRYVKSSDSSAYFKIPAGWTSYNTVDLVQAEAQVQAQLGKPQSVDDMRMNAALNWRMGFDSAPKPSAVNVVGAYNDNLIVDVRVRQLLPEERANISEDQLRNLTINVDDLQKQQDEADKGKPVDLTINKNFFLRVNQPVAQKGGFHGVQTIADVRAPDPDNRVFVFNQVAYLDKNNTKLYMLNIRCETICYENNRAKVVQIVKSFTLLDKKK